MIANAGIIVTKKLFEVTVEEWDRVLAVSRCVITHENRKIRLMVPFFLGQSPRRHALLPGGR